MKPVVGVVGLGDLGQGMAQSLRRAGFPLRVFGLRPGLAERFAGDGGSACAGAAGLSRGFMQAASAGFAIEDDSAVIKILPGIELPEHEP